MEAQSVWLAAKRFRASLPGNRRLKGLAVAGLLFGLAGFSGPGNPGDCAVEGNGWASVEGGCKDPNGVVWGANAFDVTGAYATYKSAASFCAARSDGGYSDWRVPTVAELQAAASAGAISHLNDSDVAYHARWSGDKRGTKFAWVVQLWDSRAVLVTQGSIMNVTCVRKP